MREKKGKDTRESESENKGDLDYRSNELNAIRCKIYFTYIVIKKLVIT